jgi:hypothetical protein
MSVVMYVVAHDARADGLCDGCGVAETLQITLELMPGTEPITGQLAPAGGPQRHFSGYMEMIAALDAVRAGEDRDGSTDANSPGQGEG